MEPRRIVFSPSLKSLNTIARKKTQILINKHFTLEDKIVSQRYVFPFNVPNILLVLFM